MHDRPGALLVLNRQTRRLFPVLETIFADGAYGRREAAPGQGRGRLPLAQLPRPRPIQKSPRTSSVESLCNTSVGLINDPPFEGRSKPDRSRVADRGHIICY